MRSYRHGGRRPALDLPVQATAAQHLDAQAAVESSPVFLRIVVGLCRLRAAGRNCSASNPVMSSQNRCAASTSAVSWMLTVHRRLPHSVPAAARKRMKKRIIAGSLFIEY